MEDQKSVKCVDCIHSEWQRTPTGRIKMAPGYCRMPDPEIVEYRCIVRQPVHRVRIWPDHQEGACAGFVAKDSNHG